MLAKGPFLSTAVILASVVTLTVTVASTVPDETYTEDLLLKPLKNGDLLAHFVFKTVLPRSTFSNDFHLFPREMGELVEKHSLLELEVHAFTHTLSHGY